LRIVTFLAQFAIVQPTNLLTVVNAPIDSLAVGAAHSLVAIVYVDWLETNIRHTLRLELFDGEGDVVLSGAEREPFRVEMPVEIGRPAGVPRGMTFKIPVALNLTGLHIPPGMYEWRVNVGETKNPEWNNSFVLLPPQPMSS
jgi:hypothetical protein